MLWLMKLGKQAAKNKHYRLMVKERLYRFNYVGPTAVSFSMVVDGPFAILTGPVEPVGSGRQEGKAEADV